MKQKLKKILNEIIQPFGVNISQAEIELREPPKNIPFELATNLPIVLSRKIGLPAQQVYQQIYNEINKNFSSLFNKIEFSLPGFLNFNLNLKVYLEEIQNIVRQKNKYPQQQKKNVRVLIEYVSANPTGPLHIGHARSAVIGDVLANILEQLGYEVFREYYNNDRGKQIDILTATVLSNCSERIKNLFDKNTICWIEKMLTMGMYKGDYIKQIAKTLEEKLSDNIAKLPIEEIKQKIVDIVIQEIKQSLQNFRVKFDNYYSENSLYSSGYVEKILQILKQKGLIEEFDNAVWFKSKDMGDDKDRVIFRSNGEPTYFLSDIAYHFKKLERGYDWLINIWGADHHGYLPRLKSAVYAIAEKNVKLDIILYQLVSLIRNGVRISMSTREGKFITLDEVVSEVGVDVTRFFLLTKTPDTHLEFDFDLAKEHSLKNPVYYIQYAHTRCCGIFRETKLSEDNVIEMIDTVFDNYTATVEEMNLIKTLCFYEDVLYSCIETLAPNYLCSYLIDLSRLFHKFYETCRIIDKNKISYPRLVLTLASKIVINNGLNLLGIHAPEQM